MKTLIQLTLLLVIIGCNQPSSKEINSTESNQTELTNENELLVKDLDSQAHSDQKEPISQEDLDLQYYRRQSLSASFEESTLFNLTDTIKADFNGDGALDNAFFVKDNETSGVVIIHGGLNEEVRIGFGIRFAHLDEFNWVDYWGLVLDEKTSKSTFSEEGDILDSEDVTLLNPSIVLEKDEVGGGLITFLDGKYVWIHQTC